MSELFIHSEGRGDTHLVLLHGWAMHGGVFAPLVEALRDRCTLHIVDLPGHGRSRDCGVSLQPAACVQAIAARVPAAIWLGWSLGGLYALQATLDFPQHVQGLAMLCASPRFVRGEGWTHAVSPEILQDFGRDLATDYEGTLERFLALEALGSDCAQADLRKLRADAFNEFRPQVRALTEGLDVLEHTDLRARLPELTQASAWIAGRRDRLIPWQSMQWSAAQCGGAFTCIAGGGHAPFIGHTGEVVAALVPLFATSPA
ncbi:MAG: Pimeloyl-[acyl-carrier protein] methyl ester esterase BioH [Rhodanobacteraceae bacterium]|jgi:pimeloyl-[acyl-carrier protein] methyl ester esterase|nr:MAG: Pimeloyl-[acyl-carrier protein] methyl ester esterase BioH [Rhodanobacteraceae bacterium]